MANFRTWNFMGSFQVPATLGYPDYGLGVEIFPEYVVGGNIAIAVFRGTLTAPQLMPGGVYRLGYLNWADLDFSDGSVADAPTVEGSKVLRGTPYAVAKVNSPGLARMFFRPVQSLRVFDLVGYAYAEQRQLK